MPIRTGHWQTRLIVMLAVLACFVTLGCVVPFFSSGTLVAVPEMDRHAVPLQEVRKIAGGNTEDDLLHTFGEPADRLSSCVPGRIVWRYPIRAWSNRADEGVVPAALLRITFDEKGLVKEWRFVDPISRQTLPVRETPEAASRWFERISRTPPTPPRIVIASSIMEGQSTMVDIERVFGQWRPNLGCGSGGAVPIVRRSRSNSEVVWEYYVDRPSPLFIPPHYLIANFDLKGVLQSWRFEQTYPGGTSVL